MITLWQQEEGLFVRKEKDEIDTNARLWIDARNLSAMEIQELESSYHIDHDQMLDMMDPDELSRLETDDDYTVAIARLPVFQPNADISYTTAPVGIIIFEDKIITVCWTDCEVLHDMAENRIKGLSLNDFPAFVIRVLSRADTMFLRYLKEINRRTNVIQQELQESVANNELIQLLNIEKSLTFFTTSLKSNQLLLEKIRKTRILKLDEEDRDWLDDVEIDSKQAMEMAATYSTITAGTMDAFASVINNNMNEVMRKLTVITLTLQLAAIITGFMGMNIRLPFGRSESWVGVIVISVLCLLSTVGSYLYFQYRPEKIDGKMGGKSGSKRRRK
ncbi:MAG: magnesium transporter CorA family protein [Treponema sp.]|nr:magnesium transporter CorA family protein [Treponema sp.]